MAWTLGLPERDEKCGTARPACKSARKRQEASSPAGPHATPFGQRRRAVEDELNKHALPFKRHALAAERNQSIINDMRVLLPVRLCVVLKGGWPWTCC